MTRTPIIRLGTRGSPLALAQAHEVRAHLAAVLTVSEDSIEIVIIRTSGDIIQDRPLSEAGGKGLFTKELDIALLDGAIDAAVHSSKDLPTLLPDGISIAGFLPREDVRDAFVSARAPSLAALPDGASVGSASLRRQAQVRRLRPDVRITLLRGNVETRLRKVESGEVDATLLALAGLKRLGLAHRATEILDIDDFLPAVGQGAIGILARDEDAHASEILAPLLDRDTGLALTAERAFLAVLDGSCRTPIAGLARVDGGTIHFRGLLLRDDGGETFETRQSGPAEQASALGLRAGGDLLSRAPPGFLAR